MDLGSSEVNSEAVLRGRQVSPQRAAASFARLCAMQIMAHSALTLSMLRRMDWRHTLPVLFWPKPGATTCLRTRYGLRFLAHLILFRSLSLTPRPGRCR